jgi:hypothetical protein
MVAFKMMMIDVLVQCPAATREPLDPLSVHSGDQRTDPRVHQFWRPRQLYVFTHFITGCI